MYSHLLNALKNHQYLSMQHIRIATRIRLLPKNTYYETYMCIYSPSTALDYSNDTQTKKYLKLKEQEHLLY